MDDYQILGGGSNAIPFVVKEPPRIIEITRGQYQSPVGPHIVLPVFDPPQPYYFTQEYVNTLKK